MTTRTSAKPKSVEHANPEEPSSGEWRIEPLDRLRPAKVNPRTHSAEQTRSLADIIRRYGWTRPIFYDYGVEEIVVGHGASAAARLIFEQGECIYLAPGKERGGRKLPLGHVPVLDVSGWSNDERRAYLIADNAIAEQAGWDFSMLGGEISDLQMNGFDMELLGLSSDTWQSAIEAFAPTHEPEVISHIPEEAKAAAWRQWAGELADQMEACSAVGSARQGVTPGYALFAFLRALHNGSDYPRHTQAAFHPDLYRVAGDNRSIIEGLRAVASGSTDHGRLEFACDGRMDTRKFLSTSLPFAGSVTDGAGGLSASCFRPLDPTQERIPLRPRIAACARSAISSLLMSHERRRSISRTSPLKRGSRPRSVMISS
jgi:hypothetical protein